MRARSQGPASVTAARAEAENRSAELVIVSSGPGELSNWAVPMARAAAAWARRHEIPLTLSLILPPCQFASGQEIAFARRQEVFARILGPRACLALVAGLARFPAAGPGCLLHLGGDLWYSATLGRRLGFPAFAYAETRLVRKRARRFERVFLPTQTLARHLLDEGVPSGRLTVVGDLRVDHLASVRTHAGERREGARVALLPGSRRWLVEGVLPMFLEAAAAMRARRPDIGFSLIVSPFLPRETLADILAPHQAALTALEIDTVQGDHLTAMARSDLAITLPGTNTVELAILGVPMLVAVPLHRPERIRMEGMSEWLGRIPVLGTAIKTMIARRLMQNPTLVAWPNREAGRPIVPELLGHITAEDIARRALALLDDAPGLARMSRELRGLYVTPPGVAQRMLDTMAPHFLSAVGHETASRPVKRLLIVTNGYGEDMEVAQILRALPRDAAEISAYPLVGLGRAYPPGVTLLDPRRDFPSGGFAARVGWATLWADLRHGWGRFWLAQRRTLRSLRGRVDLVVAAGDVYCLAMAAAAGGPTVYLALPRSEYIAPHSPLELWIIRRAACQVFTRDEVTAAALRRRRIPARCLGFPLMDTLAPSGETFGIPTDRPVLTLLPGSKPAAFENLALLLRAAAAATSGMVPPPAVLVAWAPHLSGERLRGAVEAAGGRWVDPQAFRFQTLEVTVTTDHFADALARATVVLGMAGAAHEQAAGLGKPVVAFPGTGPQFTLKFLREQQRLLGDALVVAASPEEAARAVRALLGDTAERARRGRIGRERQGEPGGSAAIAEYLVEQLGA